MDDDDFYKILVFNKSDFSFDSEITMPIKYDHDNSIRYINTFHIEIIGEDNIVAFLKRQKRYITLKIIL